MMDFSDLERQVLEDLKDSTHLKAVLEKFCEMKADECRRACTQAMAHVPREPGSRCGLRGQGASV